MGADHRGYVTKEFLKEVLSRKGISIQDVGTYSVESCDYSDYARAVCCSVLNGTAHFGILICCTGIGMSMAANKFPGIRAALDGDLSNIRAYWIRNGEAKELSLYVADMTEEEREIVKAGCLINYNRARKGL